MAQNGRPHKASAQAWPAREDPEPHPGPDCRDTHSVLQYRL